MRLNRYVEASEVAKQITSPELGSMIYIEALLCRQEAQEAYSVYQSVSRSAGSTSEDYYLEISRLFFESQNFAESINVLRDALSLPKGGQRRQLILNNVMAISGRLPDCCDYVEEYLPQSTATDTVDKVCSQTRGVQRLYRSLRHQYVI